MNEAMRTFQRVLHETTERELAGRRRRIRSLGIVALVRRERPDVFANVEPYLADAEADDIVKRQLRAYANESDGEQPSFPGLHFPTAIAIPDGDGEFSYIETGKARWPELVAGRATREANVARARLHLQQYDESLERVRPYMENYPERSLRDVRHLLTVPDNIGS